MMKGERTKGTGFPRIHTALPLALRLATTLFLSANGQADTGLEVWVQRYNNEVSASDEANKVVVDKNGDVIVAGFTDGNLVGSDMLVVKYSGGGVPVWTNRYGGPANDNDKALAVAVDYSGKILITGSSMGIGSSLDYLTLAYSSSGAPLWTNRYNGIGNANDSAKMVLVDSSGNAVVTGTSQGNETDDLVTIKYSNAGVAVWTNRYDGPDHLEDKSEGMVIDGNGNVLVAGSSLGSNGYWDIVTIKYSSAGLPLWTNRYDGTAGHDDVASALAVDAVGNVFLTGSSWRIGSYEDYVTIAYSNEGVPLWTNFFTGPGDFYDIANDIAVDDNGDVFVTGHIFGASWSDYLTIAYSSAGVPLWTNRYNGTSGDDMAAAIVVDRDGNVIVSGYSSGDSAYEDYLTIAYSNAGSPLWTNRYNGTAAWSADRVRSLAVNSSGNVLVTGVSIGSADLPDWLTVAYSSAGAPLWTNRYNGTGNSDDIARAVVVASNGDVIATGSSWADSSSYDYLTIAYSNSGSPLWTNRYNGPGNGQDQAQAIAVDSIGNVFVTGYSAGNQSLDYATIAYSSAGMPLWTNRYNSPANNWSEAHAVALDTNGNVFVTGYSFDNASSWDCATIAYSNAGIPLWTNRYDNSENEDRAVAIVVDSNGNVVIAGSSAHSDSFEDYLALKYSNAGAPLWTNRYNGPGNFIDRAQAVAVDRSGNVFVTGHSNGGGSFDDYATVAYSAAGVALWTNRYNGTGNSGDQARAVVVNPVGDVIVTGFSEGLASSRDYLTIKYSSIGLPLWTNRYSDSDASIDEAHALAADGEGNVFVAGYSVGLDFWDYATVAYSEAGLPLWTNRYDGPGNSHDQIQTKSSIAIAPDGAVFVTGASDGNLTSGVTYDFATVKYLTLRPVLLDITKAGDQVVLSWTNAQFRLESAPNVTGPFLTIPGAAPPHTNAIANGNIFFRLKAN